MKVITTDSQIRLYREKAREAIRLSEPEDDISDLTADIRLIDTFLVAKYPKLIPQCTVCGHQSSSVVLINEMTFCRGCLSIALQQLGVNQ